MHATRTLVEVGFPADESHAAVLRSYGGVITKQRHNRVSSQILLQALTHLLEAEFGFERPAAFVTGRHHRAGRPHPLHGHEAHTAAASSASCDEVDVVASSSSLLLASELSSASSRSGKHPWLHSMTAGSPRAPPSLQDHVPSSAPDESAPPPTTATWRSNVHSAMEHLCAFLDSCRDPVLFGVEGPPAIVEPSIEASRRAERRQGEAGRLVAGGGADKELPHVHTLLLQVVLSHSQVWVSRL